MAIAMKPGSVSRPSMGLFSNLRKDNSANKVKASYKSKTVEVKPGSKLRDAAEDLDVPVEYFCERG